MYLAGDLERRFPEDTIVQSRYLPMIHAASILWAQLNIKGIR
jgi:hypothetical protein